MRSYLNINMLDQEMLDMLNNCADGNPELINDIFDSFTPEADELIESIQKEKENIENFKHTANEAERTGDYGKVAELRYGKIKESEKIIEKKDIKSFLGLE
jgi:hypothetical protein